MAHVRIWERTSGCGVDGRPVGHAHYGSLIVFQTRGQNSWWSLASNLDKTGDKF
jgi:hypothetical protein